MNLAELRTLLDHERQAADWVFGLKPDTPNLAADLERLSEIIVDEGAALAHRKNALVALLSLTREVVRADGMQDAVEQLRIAFELTIDEQDQELAGRAQLALKTLDHRVHGSVGKRTKISR